MFKNINLTTTIAKAGITAALYVVLFLLVIPIGTGAIQFRPSELLTILPAFMPETIIGCFVGCFLSNIIGGCTIYDIILGSTITLVAGICSYFCGRKIKNFALKCAISGLFPVILNALFLPLIWMIVEAPTELYIITVFYLLVSQSISVYILGVPSAYALKRLKMTNCAPIKEPKKDDSDNKEDT